MILGSTAAGAGAAMVQLNPIADAFVSAANPNNNYGAAGSLSVAASNLAKGQFDSLIRFDVSSVKSTFDADFGPGNWTIQSVVLGLTSTAPNNPLFNSTASGQFAIDYLSDDSFIEGNGTPNSASTIPGSVTFNNQPSLTGDQSLGIFTSPTETSGTNSFTLGTSTGEQIDLTAGDPNNPLSLRLLPADNNVAYLYNSENFGTVADRPSLTVTATAVPEPASIAMLATGGLLPRRRRAR